MSNRASGRSSAVRAYFFIQHFDLALQLLIEPHQLAAPRAGMRRQHQLGQRLLSAVAP
jgi:hypothetical protein